MSGKAPLTSRPLSNELYMLCVMGINCLIQKYFGLNPDWFNDIKLLLVKNLNMLLSGADQEILKKGDALCRPLAGQRKKN